MPLHLLSKKSWNVYSPANRARVARDEALAAAAQKDADIKRRDGESASNLGPLRGQANVPDASTPLSEQEKLLLAATKNLRESHQESKKRKRLPGEDDTDRDIRYAKAQNDDLYGGERDTLVVKMRSSNQAGDAPITDKKGNINLFPEPKREIERSKPQPQTELEKEIERQKNIEENSGTRLKDAWGHKNSHDAWYVERQGHNKESRGRDVWGNEDPLRSERDAKRIVSSDPLAVMQRAQLQLTESRREREERSREAKDFRHSRDNPDLDDFSLDASSSHQSHKRNLKSQSPHQKRHHRPKHRRTEDDHKQRRDRDVEHHQKLSRRKR